MRQVILTTAAVLALAGCGTQTVTLKNGTRVSQQALAGFCAAHIYAQRPGVTRANKDTAQALCSSGTLDPGEAVAFLENTRRQPRVVDYVPPQGSIQYVDPQKSTTAAAAPKARQAPKAITVRYFPPSSGAGRVVEPPTPNDKLVEQLRQELEVADEEIVVTPAAG